MASGLQTGRAGAIHTRHRTLILLFAPLLDLSTASDDLTVDDLLPLAEAALSSVESG